MLADQQIGNPGLIEPLVFRPVAGHAFKEHQRAGRACDQDKGKNKESYAL